MYYNLWSYMYTCRNLMNSATTTNMDHLCIIQNIIISYIKHTRKMSHAPNNYYGRN